MTDTTDFHDENSIDADNCSHVIIPCVEMYSHECQMVDRRQLLHIHGITVYELTMKCQVEGCTQEANPILSEGDFPKSPREVDDLMYGVYRWFHDNATGLLPFPQEETVYVATNALIAGEEGNRSLLRSRIALFIAAIEGYQDRQQNRELKQKDQLVRMMKQQTRSMLQRLEAGQDPFLERFY